MNASDIQYDPRNLQFLSWFALQSQFLLPVIRVPVAAEHRASMGGEHSLVAVRPPDVPQLDVAILKGRGKCEIILHAELDVPYTL